MRARSAPAAAKGASHTDARWSASAGSTAANTGSGAPCRCSYEGCIAVFLFCLIATGTYLITEIYAGFKPDQTQAFLARTKTWIDTHTDQVIIIVSLVLGLWLVGYSIYLVVT